MKAATEIGDTVIYKIDGKQVIARLFAIGRQLKN